MGYELIVADSTVECRRGSLKVETPLGVFLIMVGTVIEGRVYDTVVVHPNLHPGGKKILIKKGKTGISLIKCKTARRK